MAEEAEEEAALPPLGVPTPELPHGGVPALGVPRRRVPAVAVPPRGVAAGAGGGSQMSVAMSEKLADHGVLVPVVPPGAVPGSPGPDTTIPTPAINAAAAMRMPGRRYHGEAASVSSAVRVAPGVASNDLHRAPPRPKAPKAGGFREYTSCLQTRGGIGQTGAQVVLCHGIAFCESRRGPDRRGFDMSKVCPPGTTWSSSRGLLEISSGAAPVAHTTHLGNPHRPWVVAAAMIEAAGESDQQS